MLTRNELLTKLAAIFEASPDQLIEEAGPDQIAGWDSMASLGVVSLLDDAGAADITTEDVANFKTIGAIVRFAKSHGVIAD